MIAVGYFNSKGIVTNSKCSWFKEKTFFLRLLNRYIWWKRETNAVTFMDFPNLTNISVIFAWGNFIINGLF